MIKEVTSFLNKTRPNSKEDNKKPGFRLGKKGGYKGKNEWDIDKKDDLSILWGVFMKILLVVWGIFWFSISFLSTASIANEGVPEEYVYLLKSEGGKIYRITEKITGNKKEWVKKEIRRMELISPGTTLEIEKGASVFLACGGCSVLNLTHKDSPYVVRMKDFKKEGSTKSKIAEYFTAALNNYIHPDSRAGSKANLGTRGYPKMGLCKDLWPPDTADIMPIEPITFKWRAKGTRFFLEIKEFGSNATVYSEKTMLKKIDIPLGIFKPGRRYEWFLLEEGTGEKCNATFAILSKDKASRIMEVVDILPTLLPSGMDMETKCRL
ncbi:MAG: hypothetical protein MUP41_03900, partial [Desulfobacterales bacterium]|nr:hypothetical protein [Desulfobacterales bacterium]